MGEGVKPPQHGQGPKGGKTLRNKQKTETGRIMGFGKDQDKGGLKPCSRGNGKESLKYGQVFKGTTK